MMYRVQMCPMPYTFRQDIGSKIHSNLVTQHFPTPCHKMDSSVDLSQFEPKKAPFEVPVTLKNIF